MRPMLRMFEAILKPFRITCQTFHANEAIEP